MATEAELVRIGYFTGGATVPSVIFRMPFFAQLAIRGHQCDVFHSRPARYDSYRLLGWRLSQQFRKLVFLRSLRQVRQRSYDVIVLETGLVHTNQYEMESQLRQIAKRLVYEIDDAVFLLFPEKCAALAAMADHVIAGNERIAAWVRQHNPSVSVIPTCIDLNRYQVKDLQSPSPSDHFVIGWVGSRGNAPLLRSIAPALSELSEQVQVELRVIVAKGTPVSDYGFGRTRVTCINIDRCDVNAELRQLDVGVMPLDTQDPWMEYKCNAKMIQYMASGLPAIGSDLGFNRVLIQHRVNGLLARDADWKDLLWELSQDVELRHRLGQAARKTAVAGYSVQARIDEYEAILGAR